MTIAISNVPVSDAPRYIIVGAGAIGGTLGGVLARAGIPVVLIARGSHAKVLATGGIVLRTPDETCRVPLETASSPHDVHLTPRDVLVFATKSQQLDAALQEWTDVPVRDGDREIGTAGSTLPVLTALNGIAAEEKALRYFRRVFGVCVWMPALHLTPGEVIVRSWPVVGQFHVARWPASLHTGDDDELLARLAATWTPAGVRVQLPPDVAPWKYNKLLSNLANAVGALAGSDGDTAELQVAALGEGEAVLRHAGIDFVPFAVSDAARAGGPTPRPVPGAGAADDQFDVAIAEPEHGKRRDGLPQWRDRPDRASARNCRAPQRRTGHLDAQGGAGGSRPGRLFGRGVGVGARPHRGRRC